MKLKDAVDFTYQRRLGSWKREPENSGRREEAGMGGLKASSEEEGAGERWWRR